MPDLRFLPAVAKLTIGSLDDTTLEVAAQYNPKELERSRQITWDAKNTQNKLVAGRNAERHNHLELTRVDSRAMTLELLFDAFESGESVEPMLEALDQLATSRSADSPDEELRRPHQCVVAWGVKGIRPMACVIESLSVKYTMFDRHGVPLRAVATIKVKEATIGAIDDARLTEPRPTTDRAQAWAQRRFGRAV